jgi:hypothetical protein
MEYFLHIVKNPPNCLVLEKIKAHKVFAHKLMFLKIHCSIWEKKQEHTHSEKLRILAMQLKLSTSFQF